LRPCEEDDARGHARSHSSAFAGAIYAGALFG
jgi:hypothetical protein